MIQIIIVCVLVTGALYSLGRRTYKNVQGKHSSGCEKCAAHTITKKHH